MSDDERPVTPFEPLDPAWVALELPDRPDDAHKGTFGRVLVVAGSTRYPGAAMLTALGAARAGAGLVCLAVPESLQRQLASSIPELVWLPLPEEAPGVSAPGAWRRIAEEADGYDVVVAGPGLGDLATTRRRARRLLSDLTWPLVIDADGLNALAEDARWWNELRAPSVLTPHPGEFARLARIPLDVVAGGDDTRVDLAVQAATAWGRVVVLKGARTVVAAPDGRVRVSQVATPALATAGSGDVLAGAIGALLARGLDPFVAACCGVAVHACAGLLCERRIGRSGVLASDIAGVLPEAVTTLRGARSVPAA
ncbi:MAG: NAD(P)H-hydrate dehydratase [Chloroflexota bacterium]|nr:NAD(P)H-hydrate dehydratase [Chloroflexota bacterium]